MKAAALHGGGDVRIEQIELPSLKPGEVRVGVEAALIGAEDVRAFERGYPDHSKQEPALFGREFAGVITDVADGVDDWRAGERVVASGSAPCGECSLCLHEQEAFCENLLLLNGAFAEAINLPARIVEKNLHRLKPDTSFDDAVLTESLAGVVQGVADCRLWPGDRLLVIGAGRAGLMFVALAHQLGCHVTSVARETARLEVAGKLGAHHVVHVEDDSDLLSAVRSSPAIGHGYDVVVVETGRAEDLAASVELVRNGGIIDCFSECPDGSTLTLDAVRLRRSGITIRGSFRHTPHSFGKALEFIERGVIRADDFVEAREPLENLPQVLVSDRVAKTLICCSGGL